MSSSSTTFNNKTVNKTHIISLEIKEIAKTFRFHIIFNVQVKKKKSHYEKGCLYLCKILKKKSKVSHEFVFTYAE